MLTYYDSKKLLLNRLSRVEFGKRCFNGEEYIWLELLSTFKQLGLTLENMSGFVYAVKEFEYFEKYLLNKLSLLEFIFTISITQKVQLYLNITPEGSFNIVSHFDKDWIEEKSGYFLETPRVVIPLGPIFKRFWEKISGVKINFKTPLITNHNNWEIQILSLLNNPNSKNITFSKKGNELFEVTEVKEIPEEDLTQIGRIKQNMKHGQIILDFGKDPGKVASGKILKKHRIKK